MASYWPTAVLAALAVTAAVTSGSDDVGKAYLAANAKKDGVTTLPSGLQYKVGTQHSIDVLSVCARQRIAAEDSPSLHHDP